MQSKYHMTVEQNVFVAKRNIVDYIWKSAHLEGLAVTYPDTEAIFNGLSVAGVSVKDIIAVNNLKHAWQFVLDSLDCPVDYSFVCQINRLVGGDNLVYNAGFIRNVPVTIGGTTWRPEMPIESQIKADLLRIREIVPFPVSWTVKMKKKQKETQDILSYHTQAAGCSDKARAKASGGRQPIEECGRTGL